MPKQQRAVVVQKRTVVAVIALQEKDCHIIPTIKARVMGSNGGRAMVWKCFTIKCI